MLTPILVIGLLFGVAVVEEALADGKTFTIQVKKGEDGTILFCYPDKDIVVSAHAPSGILHALGHLLNLIKNSHRINQEAKKNEE